MVWTLGECLGGSPVGLAKKMRRDRAESCVRFGHQWRKSWVVTWLVDMGLRVEEAKALAHALGNQVTPSAAIGALSASRVEAYRQQDTRIGLLVLGARGHWRSRVTDDELRSAVRVCEAWERAYRGPGVFHK